MTQEGDPSSVGDGLGVVEDVGMRFEGGDVTEARVGAD